VSQFQLHSTVVLTAKARIYQRERNEYPRLSWTWCRNDV